MKYLKHLITLVILSVSISCTFAQSTKKYSAKNTKDVVISSGIDLIIRQGSEELLEISAHASLFKNIEVLHTNGKLTIRIKNNQGWKNIFKNQQIKAYLTIRNLQSIQATGGSDVASDGIINVQNLNISASGGSDIRLNLKSNNLTASASGGSDLILTGTAENFKGSASGGSDIRGDRFKTAYANLSASGGSDITIAVVKGLTANASGGSDINYIGNPDVKQTSSGSGSIKRRN